MISKWRLGECALPGLWVNPFPWTHSWPASVWGALEWSHVVCVLAQHSAAGWCYPRGLGCGLGGFTVRILWGKTQKCSVSFHKLYMKSKPRKCQFLPRTSNIKRSIRKNSVSRPEWAVKFILSSSEKEHQLESTVIILSSNHTCISFWNSLAADFCCQLCFIGLIFHQLGSLWFPWRLH